MTHEHLCVAAAGLVRSVARTTPAAAPVVALVALVGGGGAAEPARRMRGEGEAPGAIPNGCRVEKAKEEPGEWHRLGDLATVRASFAVPAAVRRDFPGDPIAYIVEWDDLPGVRFGTRASNLKPHGRYTIHRDPPAITCHTCLRTSHHPEDVGHRYCGYCHVFHDDLGER